MAPIATVNIIPADTSLAIFASFFHSVVTKSVTDSIAVLTISTTNPNITVNMIMTNSILDILKKKAALTAAAVKNK